MKTIIISLLVSLFSISAVAQVEHLKFKGIPIDGTIIEFAQKLNEYGFETKYIEADDHIILTGRFGTYDDSGLLISSVLKDSIISHVQVFFTPDKNWVSFYDCYSLIKESLIKKYGEPTSCVENFSSGDYSNEARYDAVVNRKCHYRTAFELESGEISIEIYDGAYVILSYLDKTNCIIKMDNNIMNDL